VPCTCCLKPCAPCLGPLTQSPPALLQGVAFLTQQCTGLGLGYLSGTGWGSRAGTQALCMSLAGPPHALAGTPAGFVLQRLGDNCRGVPSWSAPAYVRTHAGCLGVIAGGHIAPWGTMTPRHLRSFSGPTVRGKASLLSAASCRHAQGTSTCAPCWSSPATTLCSALWEGSCTWAPTSPSWRAATFCGGREEVARPARGGAGVY
jgi:hypothetical protein